MSAGRCIVPRLGKYALACECLGAVRKARGALPLAFAIGISCGLVAHLVQGAVDIVHTFAPIQATFWLYAALAVALNRWPSGDPSAKGVAQVAEQAYG